MLYIIDLINVGGAQIWILVSYHWNFRYIASYVYS